MISPQRRDAAPGKDGALEDRSAGEAEQRQDTSALAVAVRLAGVVDLSEPYVPADVQSDIEVRVGDALGRILELEQALVDPCLAADREAELLAQHRRLIGGVS